jgi:DNA polymerase-3 subunit chi
MRFACRLGLKAMQTGHPVHVHVDNADQASHVDELMWDYPRHRFVPHDVAAAESAVHAAIQHVPIQHAPIQIGHEEPALREGLLINLAAEIPSFFGRFDRVAEIIVGTTKEQGRERYRYYRDRGYPLHHHELDNWES